MHKTSSRRRVAATVGIAGALAAGALITAPGAQANVGGGGCRTTGWAGTTPGVLLLPCSQEGWLADSIQAYIQVQNPNRLNIDSCAQLLRVNSNGSTTQVGDYKCNGWVSATGFGWFSGTCFFPGAGTYVVQTGYWYNNSYYGGAQSARITVY